MRKLVIASNNPGKLREIGHLLEPLGLEVLPQSIFDISEVDEPYCTFIENALAKARYASHCSGLPALADDSGICVNALNGQPGIHSARYAGEPKSDERNNQKLIEALTHQSDHNAHYYCVMVLVRHVDDPQPIIADGSWHGQIIPQPRGNGGFGYDPHFYLRELGVTSAELPLEQKNKISHRSQALIRLVESIKQEMVK
ncbi:MAG: non-canonical purine pyrophosphatase [Pseudomonadota bacterium]|jgi:XTP/dITP diphosphohydrolase